MTLLTHNWQQITTTRLTPWATRTSIVSPDLPIHALSYHRFRFCDAIAERHIQAHGVNWLPEQQCSLFQNNARESVYGTAAYSIRAGPHILAIPRFSQCCYQCFVRMSVLLVERKSGRSRNEATEFNAQESANSFKQRANCNRDELGRLVGGRPFAGK
jgi:hypothetical protein